MPLWSCTWCGNRTEGSEQDAIACHHCGTRIGCKSPIEHEIPGPNRFNKGKSDPPRLGDRISKRLGVASTLNVGSPAEVPTVSVTRAPLQPMLIVPDAHIPFHHKPSWELMLTVARDLKPHLIVCIGDLADFYAVSSHDKSPERAHRFDEELAEVDKAMDQLDSLGAADKLFVCGNHEDRLKRYLMKTPELHGVVSIEKLLQLKERGWEYVPYKHHQNRGAIHYTHDVGVSSRNAIFRSLDLYHHSIVTGHTHRLMYVVENTALGDSPKVAASFGWLGDVDQVDYMNVAKARASWAHGFGIGYVDTSTGYTYLVPIPIVHGTCCVNGRLYQ